MSEKTTCIRCDRRIDAWAKLCPYCNWDQSNTSPPPVAAPRRVEAAPNPDDDLREQLKRKGLYAGAGVLILILSFLVGMVINSDGAPKHAPDPVLEQQEKIPPVKKADTPLVPTNERGGVEQPITSAPVDSAPTGLPSGYDRSDATAVSSEEYGRLARRAKTEKERMALLVDPRSLTGVAYAQGRRAIARAATPTQVAAATQVPPLPGAPAAPPPVYDNIPETPAPPPPANLTPKRRSSVRTRPVPQYQPIPHIQARGTARLSLLIGTDGRVRHIDIERALDRNTAQLVAAVQKWRFKPATEDGEPVSAPYSVDIRFDR